MQVKNTTETSLNVADNSNDTDEIGMNDFRNIFFSIIKFKKFKINVFVKH